MVVVIVSVALNVSVVSVEVVVEASSAVGVAWVNGKINDSVPLVVKVVSVVIEIVASVLIDNEMSVSLVVAAISVKAP